MWGKDNIWEHGWTSHRRDASIDEYSFRFQALLSLNSLNPLVLFAVSWHCSLGCFICGNAHETPVSMPNVTELRSVSMKKPLVIGHSLLIIPSMSDAEIWPCIAGNSCML